MKKKGLGIKIYIPLLGTGLLVIQSVILFLLLSQHRNTEPQKFQIHALIEENYEKRNFRTAEALAAGVLINDPTDIESALWLEKIAAERRMMDAARSESGEYGKNEDAFDAKTGNEQLAALRSLKKSIDDMKKGPQTPPVVINTVREYKPAQKNDAEKPDPLELERFFTAGVNAYLAGDYHAARSNLGKVLAADPGNPQANAYMGAALFEENPLNDEQLKSALHFSKKALDNDKSNKTAFETLGKIYESSGNRELAVENYLEAAAIDPEDAGLPIRLGNIYYQAREYDKAEASFFKAISLNPDQPFAYYYLAKIARAGGDREQAVANLSAAISRDSGFFGAYTERGDVRFELEDYDGALEDFRKAVSMRDGFYVRARAGDCLLRAGLTERAMDEYRYALEHTYPVGAAEKERAAALYQRLALHYEQSGRMGEAYGVIQNAIAARIEIAALYVVKGRIESLKNETASAMESFRRAISIEPGAVDGYCELALLYSRSGERVQALNVMRELTGGVSGSADHPLVRKTLAQLEK